MPRTRHRREGHHQVRHSRYWPGTRQGAIHGEQMTGTHRDPQPQRYQICVRGHLGETIRSAFPALQARTHSGNTVLTGILPDQAALYGVLAEAEALGLELIELRRLPSQESQDPSS
jgi:hypothetical protein